MSSRAKLRTFASFLYQAGSWKRPRKVVARLKCSLQPVAGETGMRQEVDIRYVVTSLKGSGQHLYENVYCRHGQTENLIKLHKAQLASDRMSCHSATANQVRLILHTAPFWLMHGVRAVIPQANAREVRVRDDTRAPDQDRGARDRAYRAYPRAAADELPGRGAIPVRRTQLYGVRPMSRGAVCPDEPPTWPINPERAACRVASHRSRRTERRHASARLTCKKVPRDAGSGLRCYDRRGGLNVRIGSVARHCSQTPCEGRGQAVGCLP
jgi:Transposase DDE domain group 1